ncbi:heterokaryon incompatibility protein-domain-containing protein [Ilyonectria robusta]|uniref:heterokaryon incompatibility protein-domain-containing protein n=1 Tax=Ilyonectria robusta TaxID=1079257 RepID=UPI001E8DB8A2|nr:heterokaryon incompatibility protein-domain-containing protein [Ilyonectria robusta]KAH8672209.1 heterokaryon incompatibility protein-domain-containing protein [Ilyonectria robusta]
MTLCGRCLQVVRKEHPMIRISGEEPTVDHHNTFRALRQSAKSCELCKAILESARHDRPLEEEADLERAFQGLKLRVEVNHYLCTPYQSSPPSANDISAWGLRAYWVREEMSTRLILRKELDDTRERPIWTSSRPAAVEALLPTILTWLKECDDTHTSACSLERVPELPVLPTRCIDVGKADGSAQPRLAISGGCHGRYTTLSHCWGKGRLPARLTTSSVLPLSDAIHLDTLPRTYRDAISITRALGIRYIWIDSLCIIQDDTDDWERESANMASIYRNAYLNIAATSALDSDGGCMHTPRPTTSFQIEPAPRWSSGGRFPGAGPFPGVGPGATRSEQATPALVRPSGSARKLEKAALNTRAWVLQEVCLSRRTIHFAQDQMYWFCAEREASEDGTHVHTPHYGSPRAPLLGPPHWLMGQSDQITRGSVYTMWWTLVEDYSSRALTHASDKMAALAGLTQFFQERLGEDEPVAGMWKAELVDSLCWTCDPVTDEASRTSPGPPSWSWTSVDGPIRRNCCRMPNELPRQRSENEFAIESVDVGWSGRPMTSSIQGGRLVGRGLLAELDFRLEEEHLHHCASAGKTSQMGQMILYFQGESHVVGRFRFDRHAGVSRGAVRCLAVTLKQVTLNFCPPQEPVYFWFHVLILEPTGREDGEFRRIGAGKVWANSGVFDQVQPQVVQIV